MKATTESAGTKAKAGPVSKADLATRITAIEKQILKTVPYDNWSAGDGIYCKNRRRAFKMGGV